MNEAGTAYGFLTLGHLSVWHSSSHTLSNIPIHRTCVKWISNYLVKSVEVLNEDRWLPDDECYPDRVAVRPDTWTYDNALEEDKEDKIILRAGYNCQITFSALENKVIIQPRLQGGLGVVSENIKLGYDAETEEPEPILESPRYDTIKNRRYVRSFAGAYGERIAIVRDNNFVNTVGTIEGPEGSVCEKDVLIVRYVREGRDCIDTITPDLEECED
jgi:hypothetical protein